MKYKFLVAFVFLYSFVSFSQEDKEVKKYTIDASQFYGTILRHNPDVTHLINSHPGGLLLSVNKKTFGFNDWEQRYNYPELGYSFIYQDFNNGVLGSNYSVYTHLNFYFFKRNLQLRTGQGIAYATNPYDKETNFRNNAFGSTILSSTYLMLNYNKENIISGLGFKAGVSFIHYSNANVKAPNTSVNTLAFNVGLIYDLDESDKVEFLKTDQKKITEPIRYNLAFRTGINESDIIDSGQYPFYIFSGYADKRLGTLSAIQLGADVYFSNFLKELINFSAIAFPDDNNSNNQDYKRVGVFVGHELFINKMSITSQLGYYVYYPFNFEGRVYNRLGMKRYFGDKVFGELSLKSHGAKAEALEFGIGIRL